MAKKIKNQPEQAQEQTFSFRMILRKPSCLKADETFDTEKLRELIAAAKAGDQEAKVLGITTRTVDRAIVRIKDCLSEFNS